jgi:S1-C subfamily serine protease
MFCIHCGRPCGAADTFCGNCGKNVPPEIRSSARLASSTPVAASPKSTMGTVWAIAISSVVALSSVAYFASRAQPAAPASNVIVASPSTQVLDHPGKFASSVLTLYCYDKGGKPIGQGSGFVIRQDGVVVTDWHVAKNAFSIVAVDGSGRKYTISRYVNVDPNSDLVLLQLANDDGSEPTLQAIPVADSRKVSAGLKIYTISAPKGFSHTLSDGLLSAIRSVDGLQLLQITAPVSPGSSGGPVLNAAGEVVGVIEGLIPSGQQLNFAIPIDYALRLLNGAADFARQQPTTDAGTRTTARQTDASDFERGRVALGEKNYLIAARIFTTYLKSHPEEGAAAFNAALCYIGLNEFGKAAAFFKIFLRLAPEDDPDIGTAKKWIAAFEESSSPGPSSASRQAADGPPPVQREDSLNGRYRLVGSVDTAKASLRLTIGRDSTVTGKLTIDDVLQDEEVVGSRHENGQLTLRLRGGSTLVGSFDGQRYSGTVAVASNGASASFQFHLEIRY